MLYFFPHHLPHNFCLSSALSLSLNFFSHETGKKKVTRLLLQLKSMTKKNNTHLFCKKKQNAFCDSSISRLLLVRIADGKRQIAVVDVWSSLKCAKRLVFTEEKERRKKSAQSICCWTTSHCTCHPVGKGEEQKRERLKKNMREICVFFFFFIHT